MFFLQKCQITWNKTYFKLLKRKESSSLIVTHIVVPSLGKLQKLCFLGSFDVLQLYFLSCDNVVSLSLGFFLEQLIKLGPGLSSLSIVALLLTLAPVLFKQSQEVKYFGISCHIDHSSHRRVLFDHTWLNHLRLVVLLLLVHWSTTFDNLVLNLLHQV